MAITSENYKKAEDWLSKAKSDPSVNKSKIAQIEQDLRSFYEGESSGALPTTSQSAPAARRSGIAGYYYEPSVEEFRNAITNPEVQKSLNLQDRFKNDYVQPVGEKTLSNNELLDPNTYVGSTAKLDPKYLGEDSSEYKAYADYAYNKEKTNNPNLHRYSDLDITTSPFKKALGAAIKYGPAAVLGAEKSIALGIPRKTASVVAGNIPNSAADTEYDAMGAPSGGEYHPEKAERVIKSVEDLESLSPGANTAGNFAGYAVPIAPANLAARGMMSSLGYETAGPLTKAAISGLTGSTVASGEGAAQDIIDNPGISGQELWDNTKPRAFWGGVAGSALDLVAQGAGRTQKAIEESPRWSPIKNQKDIGGDTNFITGIQTTPEVRENVRLGTGPRQNVTPQDIAAQKVAPQFRESIDLKNTNARKTVDATLEEYLNRPEVANQQESMQPVAEGILDMFSKGTFEGAVTGDIKHSNQGAVDTFKKALMSIGEIAHMAPEEAALYAKNNNGIMLSPKQLKGLGITSEAGKVPVYVASKINPRALLEMEKMVDEKLKMAGTEGGINNPIWKDINRSVKSVRDRFGVPAEIASVAGQLNLTPAETEALNNAKSSLAFLRNPPEQYKEALASALEKTKKANPGTLYRGMRISQDDLDKMLKNGYPIDVHTMSSPDRESASRFAQGFDNKVPVVLQMEGTKSANMVHGYNGDQFPKENSAVLSPGQKYNVTGTEDISIPGEKAWMDTFSGKLVKMSRQDTVPPVAVERRSPNRPTNEQWQAMESPEGINHNTPISETPEHNTVNPEVNQSSVGPADTEPPHVPSDPAPVNEIRGNKRYQEPSVSEYTKMQNGENVDKSGNGYQRLVDTQDFAPGYRLRTNPDEISSLNKLAEETDAISGKSSGPIPEDYTPEFPREEVLKDWNGAPFPRDKSPFRPSRIGKDYGPEWTPNEDLYTANPPEDISVAPIKSENPKSVVPDNVVKLPTAQERAQAKIDADNQEFMDNIKADRESPDYPKKKEPWYPEGHIQSYDKKGRPLYGNKDGGLTPFKPPRPEENKSLFPEVKDQESIPSPSKLAQERQTPDVGKVKDIVSKTDEIADNLTTEELDAIHSYTSRKGEKVGTPEWDSATKKLTIDNPTDGGTLHYGTRLPQEKIDEILKTKSFSLDKPTSTSYNEGIASAMAHSRAERGEPVVFKIDKVDNGVSLASKKLGIRGTNNEKEILLHKKDFEVIGSSKDADGNLVINLKQKLSGKDVPEATLEDGTKVRGLSAVQRKNHLMLKELDDIEKALGTGTEESAHRKVLGYKTGEGRPYTDKVIAQEADELGLRQQLEEIPATREYPGLRARAFAGGGEGPMNTLKDFLGFRLDPVLGAIAGESRNPYTAMPNTPAGRIQQYLFRQGVPLYPLLEQKGGLGAARFADDYADRNREKK